MAVSMVTKNDLQHLSTTLHEAIKMEVARLKTDVAAHETRIHAAEQKLQAAETQAAATDMALKRQGALILAMRRQLEDQDNSGRRNNIRNRGHYRSDKPGGEDGTRQAIHPTTPEPAQRTQKNNKPADRRRWAAPEDPTLSNHH
ncbi:Hypothetical predicted protein [Pelobates cultripes]|uniref:Uncharacterized protein n=1 Tax=Pelobates cultripes TaxID=61616 RepID=A0AAD1SUN1_PELCU|nr:Hypothetical predicted protein [Pelobates cultripes]